MEVKLGLNIQSTSFEDSEQIPEKYTCNSENVSPPLKWSKADSKVKSWTLIMEDPDAAWGIFTHWVIYNIPAAINSLSEGVPTTETLQNGAMQGKNDTMKTGYTGPCPPPGPVHHYNFTIFAVDKKLNLTANASKIQVLDAMKGHIISRGKLTATYQR
jgi:Raf kinase inhibitor-like YbhB/YbcL family protein